MKIARPPTHGRKPTFPIERGESHMLVWIWSMPRENDAISW